MPFDVSGARAAGFSDKEIADELASTSKFDAAAAREAGFSDADIINELQPAPPPATAIDRVQAAASGINSGFASTLGLPVDTLLNAADVGSAVLGAGYLGADYLNRKFGGDGVDIPAFIKLQPRRQVLGSSENIKAGLNAINIDTAPARPDDRASRYLNTAANLGAGAYFGGIYNKLPIPSGITPRPGAPPVSAAPPGTPVGGPAGAPPPQNFGPPGTPAGGLPPGTPPALPPAGAAGGPPLPPPIGLNATEKATLAAGERLGLQVTPGVRTGSPQLRQIEARLESYPSTSGPLFNIKANNAKIVQQQFLRAIGERGDEVSSDALASAASRIGKVFDDAAANNKIAYDNDLQNALSDIGQRSALELTEAEGKVIQNQLNEIVSKAAQTGGVLEGPAFQSIYSALGRISGGSGPGGARTSAAEIRDALHDALIRSAGPKAAEKLRTARDQYRVLITAEKSGALNPEAGTLRAGQLASAFARGDKRGFGRGYNDSGLYDALRFSRSPSFGPIVGNSGTPTRLGNPNGFFDVTRYAAGNLGTRAYLNTPPSVLAGGVRAGNATREIVRDMLGIPRYAAPQIIIGLDAASDDLRKGLYQQ